MLLTTDAKYNKYIYVYLFYSYFYVSEFCHEKQDHRRRIYCFVHFVNISSTTPTIVPLKLERKGIVTNENKEAGVFVNFCRSLDCALRQTRQSRCLLRTIKKR